MMATQRILMTGAAGFIGSQLVDRMLAAGHEVIGLDNLVRGTLDNIAPARNSSAFRFINVDVSDFAAVQAALEGVKVGGIDALWHMAANSDIGAGMADPDVDYRDTFLTTHVSLKVARALGIKKIAFASSSAIYGEHEAVLREDTGPLLPISNYGAMKLASEAAISAACETWLERAWMFRFPNVVGGRSTHGVIYDLLGKLKRMPNELEVLGNGTQLKPYLHVSELIDAMLFIVGHANEKRNFFNVGVDLGDATTVKYIAEKVVEVATGGRAKIRFTGGDRGWPGDVPRFQYSTAKLTALGWRPKLKSNEAIDRAVVEIAREQGL